MKEFEIVFYDENRVTVMADIVKANDLEIEFYYKTELISWFRCSEVEHVLIKSDLKRFSIIDSNITLS